MGVAYGRVMEASPGSSITRIATGSLVIGVVVLALKSYAAYLTGSIALFSDALESIVNVVTAIVALVAVRLAARPADATPFSAFAFRPLKRAGRSSGS